MHYRCALQKLEAGWPTSRITFNFMNCGLCAEECEKHASTHEHCRICAEHCHRCEQACSEAVQSIR